MSHYELAKETVQDVGQEDFDVQVMRWTGVLASTEKEALELAAKMCENTYKFLSEFGTGASGAQECARAIRRMMRGE